MAERADVVVLCLGLSAEIEGEQGDAGNSEAAGDKAHLNLTGLQQRLLEELTALGKPTVLVLLSGSALAVNFAEQQVGAILQAWYPGEEGGTAIAEALFGVVNPGGRLPITFPRSLEHVPAFTDYGMKGRTYRYLEHEPLFPFGFGLSYTRFAYSALEISQNVLRSGERIDVSVTLANVGERAGDEVVQLYLKDLSAPAPTPHHSLRGFRRVTLEAGQTQVVRFSLPARAFSRIDAQGRRALEPGRFRLYLGGSQPDRRSLELTGHAPLEVELEVSGARQELAY
jgi:beta-glucosidase